VMERRRIRKIRSSGAAAEAQAPPAGAGVVLTFT
jgi:hypothetical protein